MQIAHPEFFLNFYSRLPFSGSSSNFALKFVLFALLLAYGYAPHPKETRTAGGWILFFYLTWKFSYPPCLGDICITPHSEGLF